MAEEDEQAVALGEGELVDGVPLARVSARLMWGIEKSAIDAREGETVVRTPDGPRQLGEILDAVDVPYFATQREFESAVREVVGSGPVPTAGEEERDEGGEDDREADDEEETPGEGEEEREEESTGDGEESSADESTQDEETGEE